MDTIKIIILMHGFPGCGAASTSKNSFLAPSRARHAQSLVKFMWWAKIDSVAAMDDPPSGHASHKSGRRCKMRIFFAA